MTINLSNLPSGPVLTASTSAAPPPPRASSVSAPPASTANQHFEDPQTCKWQELVQKFGSEKLDQHQWEWIKSKWVPHYTYQPVHAISDVWYEWVGTPGGGLSVRELTETWGARWRRNNSVLKTENTRRKKIVDLVNTLSSKQGWNVSLALRFLSERYETTYTARSFSDYLGKAENQEAVLAAAKNFIS